MSLLAQPQLLLFFKTSRGRFQGEVGDAAVGNGSVIYNGPPQIPGSVGEIECPDKLAAFGQDNRVMILQQDMQPISGPIVFKLKPLQAQGLMHF